MTSRQDGSIVRMLPVNFDSRHNVGFHAAYDMRLNLIVLLSHHAVLLVKPAREARCHKSARVHSKLSLNRLERQCTARNQIIENRHQLWILKVIENAVVVRNVLDKSLRL